VDVEKLYFVVECENPATAATRLTFSFAMLQEGDLSGAETFKLSLAIEPGYSVITLPVTKFKERANLERRFVIQISPANPDERPTLTFGLLDIVELSAAPTEALQSAGNPSVKERTASPAIKCVVWDLDNTLWTGTLVEDGLEALKLKDVAAEAVRALDRKGILQSIASKNDFQDAQEALRKFSLDQYFLFPQISWRPKSESIGRIRSELNIGIDTFAFVDDQDFERAEVTASLPAVLAVDANQIEELMRHPRLDVPVTEEGSKRRMLYQAEAQREQAQTAFGSSYEEFLRSCAMTVAISRFAQHHLDRVYELVQRTNQLNISTYRYSRDELCNLLAGNSHSSYVVQASDRFGDYGLIGFIVFDPHSDLILDMMFSCRIQGKLVDDAFLAWLFECVAKHPPGKLDARFRASKKNAPARQLLERHGFSPRATDQEFTIWTKAAAGRTLEGIRQIIVVDVSPDAL
jgi:FkbH-like protein